MLVEGCLWALIELIFGVFTCIPWGEGSSSEKRETAARRRRTFEEICRAADRKLGGSTEARSSGDFAIRFRVKGRCVQLLLESPETSLSGESLATVDLGGRIPGTLRVARAGIMAVLREAWGGAPIRAGDPEFDRWFEVRSRPESLARALFVDRWRGRVIKAFMTLDRRRLTPSLDFENGAMTVRVNGRFSSEEEILEFARLVTVLAEALLEAEEDPGIAWCGESESGGECQVCGSTMLHGVVRCAKCGTPHHGECWRYNGVCSTYGCGSRESR